MHRRHDIALVEGVRGRPLPANARLVITLARLAALLTLLALTVANDSRALP